MRAEAFFDTNVILYLLESGTKADVAQRTLAGRGVVSVQDFNEALVNSFRRARLSWEQAGLFLDGIREVCTVVDLTVDMHDIGRALGQRYGLSTDDAMIVAAAMVSGCTVLYSEDMHDGLVVEDVLRIVDPFRESRP